MLHVNGRSVPDPLWSRHSDHLRQTWQARCLAYSHGKIGPVMLCVLAHSYFDALDVLIRVVYPNLKIKPPCWTGTAHVTKDGRVVCNMIDGDGAMIIGVTVFEREDQLTGEFRRMADRLRLDDTERRALFDAVQMWVVADHRIGPEPAC
jgi:hypothetical protein